MIEDNNVNVKTNNFENIFNEISSPEKSVSILIDKNLEKDNDLEQVVFATDFSDSSFKTYLNVLEVAKTEKFAINFLHVNPNDNSGLFSKTFKAALKRFTQICPIANIGIIWETTAANIAKGIEEVVDKFGGELVVVACNNQSINLRKPCLENFAEVKSQLPF